MRKTKELKIETGRDAGKRFRITEMSAVSTEKWANKCILAIINSGIELPENFSVDDLSGTNGLIALFSEKFLKSVSGIKYEMAEQLYDELLKCVEFLGTDGNKLSVSRQMSVDIADEIVEDFKTLLLLRWEVIKLQFGFLDIGGKAE